MMQGLCPSHEPHLNMSHNVQRVSGSRYATIDTKIVCSVTDGDGASQGHAACSAAARSASACAYICSGIGAQKEPCFHLSPYTGLHPSLSSCCVTAAREATNARQPCNSHKGSKCELLQ